MIGKRIFWSDGIAGLLGEKDDHFFGRRASCDAYLQLECSASLPGCFRVRTTKQRRHAGDTPDTYHFPSLFFPAIVNALDVDESMSVPPFFNTDSKSFYRQDRAVGDCFLAASPSERDDSIWQLRRVYELLADMRGSAPERGPSAFSGEAAYCDAALLPPVFNEPPKIQVSADSASSQKELSWWRAILRRLSRVLSRPILYLLHTPATVVHTDLFFSGGKLKEISQRTITELWQGPNLVRAFLRNAIIQVLRLTSPDAMEDLARRLELEQPIEVLDNGLRLLVRTLSCMARELSEVTVRRQLERWLEDCVRLEILSPSTWVKLTKAVHPSARRKWLERGMNRWGCMLAIAKTGAWGHVLLPASAFLVSVTVLTAKCLASELHHTLQDWCRSRSNSRACFNPGAGRIATSAGARNNSAPSRSTSPTQGTSVAARSARTPAGGRQHPNAPTGGNPVRRGLSTDAAARDNDSKRESAINNSNNGEEDDDDSDDLDGCPIESRARWGGHRPLAIVADELAFPRVPADARGDGDAAGSDPWSRRRKLAAHWARSTGKAARHHAALYGLLVAVTPLGTLVWPGRGTYLAVAAAPHLLDTMLAALGGH